MSDRIHVRPASQRSAPTPGELFEENGLAVNTPRQRRARKILAIASGIGIAITSLMPHKLQNNNAANKKTAVASMTPSGQTLPVGLRSLEDFTPQERELWDALSGCAVEGEDDTEVPTALKALGKDTERALRTISIPEEDTN